MTDNCNSFEGEHHSSEEKRQIINTSEPRKRINWSKIRDKEEENNSHS